ncbi:substrate-binding domain-containing protein [Jiangella mangrovi]|uniref:ABC-type sugar transport system substrate-binding protein n=1 Tax=Jiangella mangrovi TaxID=1524084 RepID=A0A7W9GX16_9ACTN|nr:substrate-binding domain-containing protein [Jiangella mangrovi]MBB5791241.1 ABC-type sugar transport system substrate-binding protein [Jiangella mangrovi]
MSVPFDRKVRVGVTEKNQHAYWDMVNAGWHDAAGALGLDLRIEAPPSEDVAAQVELMRRQLDDGVDALAFVATRADAFDEIVAEADRRGVPVVAFDLDAPTSGRLTFVGMPAIRDVANRLGDVLAERLPAGSTVIAQTGSDHAPGAAAKLAGFLESMQRHGHRVVVGESDGEDVARSLQVARRLLEENPEAAGMYGVYGYHPIVQARAAELAGRPDLTIVGYDLLPETVDLVESGAVACSVWIQEYYFGYHTAVLVNALARTGSREALRAFRMDPDDLAGNAVYPPVAFHTKDTIAGFRSFAAAKSLQARTATTVL